MAENPWLHLPTEPPYVLPEDRKAVDDFNRALDPTHKHYLHTDKLLPEAFIGAKDAPVVLLSNNPGFEEKGIPFRQADNFRAMMRNNLHHVATDWPFVYLNPAFDAWGTWWRLKRLRWLIAEFDQQTVARCILNVVYFPYASLRFGHKRLRLPSQDYGFDLVRNAVSRNAVIILMRPGKREAWETAVPQLKDYGRFFQVQNPQNPAISPNNCLGYSEIVRAIATFVNARSLKTGGEHAPVS